MKNLGFILFSLVTAFGLWTAYFSHSLADVEGFVEAKSQEKFEFLEDYHQPYEEWMSSTDSVVMASYRIEKDQSFSQALAEAGISERDRAKVLELLKPEIDFKSLPVGLHFSVRLRANDEGSELFLDWLGIDLSSTEQISVQASKDRLGTFELLRETLEVETFDQVFSGSLESNLWDSARNAGMDPSLIADLADIFAWEIDFEREVRQGDRWRIVVERKRVEAKVLGFGRILAAEYVNGGELHQAVWFASSDGNGDYYRPDGNSLKRMFLKSPMKFARISSRFKLKRFHPVLKRTMPHNGVDYAAPTGTPVMSVGDGTIEFSGRNGGSGIMVKVRHNANFQTAYLHLSGIAGGLRKGARVRQGQVVGFVGATGLATGPHLHFSFYENGRYVDPLGKKFPSKDPLPQSQMEALTSVSNLMLSKLPSWDVGNKLGSALISR